MIYEGKLYGKIGRRTFDTGYTSERSDRMQKVDDAARCINHWRDRAPDGMVVSADAVRDLWFALSELDDLSRKSST